MTERAEVLSIPNLDTRNSVPFKMERISSLPEVLGKEPFLTGEKIVTVLDLDGVLCEYGEKNNSGNNLSRLLALKNIISKSDEFIVYSSRFNIDEESYLWKKVLKPVFGKTSIVKCPFMVQSSMNRLEGFVKKANENCEFKYLVGLKKMRSCFKVDDDLQEIAQKTLEQNKKLVMVGSSVFDKTIARKNLNLENLFYFDTGHILI